MLNDVLNSRIPIQLMNGCAVASIQVDLTESTLKQFQADLLERIQLTGVKAAIFDLSGIDVMDAVEFQGLRETMTMVSIMGAQPILAGLQAGTVSILIDADADIEGIQGALDLDAAFGLVHHLNTEPGSDDLEPLEQTDDFEEADTITEEIDEATDEYCDLH